MKIKYDPIKPEAVTQATMSAVEQELYALAYEIQGRVQSQISEQHITASGAAGLLGSWQVTHTTRADGKVSAIRVGSLAPYASYVEFGTRPHFPPIRPLFMWVEKKLDVVAYGVKFEGGKAKYTGKVKRQFKRQHGRDRNLQILAVARRIQWAIAKRGTRARLYMKAALDSLGLTAVKSETSREGLVYYVNYEQWLASRKGAIKARLDMQLGGE